MRFADFVTGSSPREQGWEARGQDVAVWKVCKMLLEVRQRAKSHHLPLYLAWWRTWTQYSTNQVTASCLLPPAKTAAAAASSRCVS